MVAMQMADENMVYALQPDVILAKLELGSFSTIDQEKPFIMID
jgi:hypothetical protein